MKAAPTTPAVNMALSEHERFSRGSATAKVGKNKFALSFAQENLVASLPAGVGRVLRLLYQRGMDVAIHRAMRERDHDLLGIKAHRSLKLALELLMIGGFNKRELKCSFVAQLGWSERSAWSQVSLTWLLLLALGVAIERDQYLSVAPEFQYQNYVF